MTDNKPFQKCLNFDCTNFVFKVAVEVSAAQVVSEMFIKFFALVLVFSVAVAEDCHSVTDLSLILFKGSLDAVDVVFLNNTKSLLVNPAYDKKKSTLIYGFGYTETYQHPSSRTIAKAYLTRNDSNIIIIDWSKYNKGNYFLDALPYLMKVRLNSA